MDAFIKEWVEISATDDVASCHFCGNIGVVYLGVKPAEIIHVSREKFHRCTLLRNQLEFRVLEMTQDKIKLFVFHRQRLEEILNKKNIHNHLKKLGYGEEFDLDAYVATLVGRLRSNGIFPHEIGFFLGYPVKDVLSFMGLIDLPLVKTMGWRMYGDTRISEELYYKVKNVKTEIINYAKQTHNNLC
ncbi:MAG: hypothetical protein H6Q61_432 [Firmicutes bacterium]|nr:hypothetical protein [Bacillota bacterium]